jgi:D-glycero-alpha-D-manno-heptose-7-phosphate kinase
MIIARTPLRVSLVGGGTDLDEFLNFGYEGAAVSFTIKKYVYISLKKNFNSFFRISYSSLENKEKISQINHKIIRNTLNYFKINSPLEIISSSDVPDLGTGLGSSSAFTTGLIILLKRFSNQKDNNKKNLVNLCTFIEKKLVGNKIGLQDQCACAYGGLNFLKFYPNKSFSVAKINLSEKNINSFTNNLFLVYTNIQRSTNNILKKIKITKSNLIFFNNLTNLANLLKRELDKKNYQAIGDILDESWELKKSAFGKNIYSNYIDDLYKHALLNGAEGGKLLGAGRGGFFLFYVKNKNKKKFLNSFNNYKILNCSYENQGSKIIYNDQ